MRPVDRFDIDANLAMAPRCALTAAPAGGTRREPALATGPLWVGFGDEGEEAAQPLDPGLPAPARDESAPAPVVPASRAGVLTSLGVHLAVLLLLIHPATAPIDAAAPIPVQLVIEQPSPPPVETRPPPGPLASENMGEPSLKPSPAELSEPPPPPLRTAPAGPPDSRVAAVIVPPPKPAPTPIPRPAPAAAPVPARPPPPRPEIRPAAHPVPPQREPARRAVTAPGPNATRDEYLAHLVALTRRHLDLLPLSLVGQRHGVTILHLLILGDGTIARIAVAQGSGYPDIDERIEQIVVAVHRFPPLPQWYEEPAMELDLRLRFPDALEE